MYYRGIVFRLFLCALVIIGLSACVKRTEFRGFYFDEHLDTEIKTGMHVNDVIEKMGSPTTSSAFGQPIFFYIHAQYEQRLFFSPELVKQRIMAVYFSKDGKVSEVKRYDIAEAKKVSFSTDRTVIEGNEMGALEQIMGNIGRFSNERTRKPGL